MPANAGKNSSAASTARKTTRLTTNTVDRTSDLTGTFSIKSHGDGEEYYFEKSDFVTARVNPETGKSITTDGTVPITSIGPFQEFSYDQNGTPDDGDYDTMVDFGYTHEVGHRNDQWCDLVYDTLT